MLTYHAEKWKCFCKFGYNQDRCYLLFDTGKTKHGLWLQHYSFVVMDKLESSSPWQELPLIWLSLKPTHFIKVLLSWGGLNSAGDVLCGPHSSCSNLTSRRQTVNKMFSSWNTSHHFTPLASVRWLTPTLVPVRLWAPVRLWTFDMPEVWDLLVNLQQKQCIWLLFATYSSSFKKWILLATRNTFCWVFFFLFLATQLSLDSTICKLAHFNPFWTTMGWMAMTFCTDIHEICQELLNGSPQYWRHES